MTTSKISISAERLAELEQSEKELTFLKTILPSIIGQGAIAQLHERPSTAEHCLSWHSMSNADLKADRSEVGGYEKLRRAFLGIQAYNSSVEPERALYPTGDALCRLSEVDMSSIHKWLTERIVNDEMGRYCDLLGPGLTDESQRRQHNEAMLRSIEGGICSVVSWPSAYD